MRARGTKSSEARRSLFSGKRSADSDDENSPLPKKSRAEEDIIQAVERLEARETIADGSRDYVLPTIAGKHSDLKSISVDTMAQLVRGTYSDEVAEYTVVDCRYPYEYEGGHVRGAVNLYTKDSVKGLLDTPATTEKRHILVFHCEFSSERGPKMYRHLRSEDRTLNAEHYPRLNYPEVYLLHGGYKAFYEAHSDLCDPDAYKPMLHEDHAEDLRHFRVKSKSWTAGEKTVTSRKHRSRIARLYLDWF